MKRRMLCVLAPVALMVIIQSGCIHVTVTTPSQSESTTGETMADIPVSSDYDNGAEDDTANEKIDIPGKNNDASGEISREEAIEISMENADVPVEDAYNIKAGRDRAHGRNVYDIEFETDYGDYDFEIDLDSGEIVGADYEVDDEWVRRQADNEVSYGEAKEIVSSKAENAPVDEIGLREESEDGESRYEGRVIYDSMVYEFELDPRTGIIFDWNADLRD